jgi:L-amino acid N-acyltransferase YncA
MAAALASIDKPVYSHIERNNLASVRAHEKCGFKKITNFAVLLDGSVSQNADTYLRKFV